MSTAEAAKATEARKATHPNEHWVLWSWASAGAALVVVAVVMLVSPAPEAGHVTGRLLSSAVLAALAAGLLARRSRRVWPWWRYPLVIAPVEILLVVAEGVAGSS